MGVKRIAINGLGRIGRNVLKQLVSNDKLVVAAVNDLAPTSTLAHLIKYDSVFGIFKGTISFDENHLILNGKKIPVYSEKDPALLPWKTENIAIVIECTGKFTNA